MKTRNTKSQSILTRTFLLVVAAIVVALAGGSYSLAAAATPDVKELATMAINAMSTSSPQSEDTNADAIAQIGSLLSGSDSSGGDDVQLVQKAIAQIIPSEAGDILNVTSLAGPFLAEQSDDQPSRPVSPVSAIDRAVPNGTTILAQGGTGNPSAAGMEKMLGGDIARQGGKFVKVTTPQQFNPVTGLDSMTFDASRNEGTDIMVNKIVETIRTTDEPVVVVGYSQSASQDEDTRQKLADAGVAGNKVSFVDYGDPRNPNGIETKFAGLSMMGITMRGEAEESPYKTTSINRQYGLYEDVPDNMLNFASTANWLIGGLPAHGQYADSIANEQSMSYTEGNRTQVLLLNKSLPLADGLRQIGVPVDAGMEAELRKAVDAGYDRSKYTKAQNVEAPAQTNSTPAPSAIPAAVAPAAVVAPITDMATDWAASQPEPVKQWVDQGISQLENFANMTAPATSEQSYTAPQASYQAPAMPQFDAQQITTAVNNVVAQVAPQMAPQVNDVMNGFANAIAGFHP